MAITSAVNQRELQCGFFSLILWLNLHRDKFSRQGSATRGGGSLFSSSSSILLPWLLLSTWPKWNQRRRRSHFLWYRPPAIVDQNERELSYLTTTRSASDRSGCYAQKKITSNATRIKKKRWNGIITFHIATTTFLPKEFKYINKQRVPFVFFGKEKGERKKEKERAMISPNLISIPGRPEMLSTPPCVDTKLCAA